MTDFLKEGMTTEEVKQAILDNGGMVTGDKLENFKRGWAKMGFRGHKAHYYVEVKTEFAVISKQGQHKLYESLCGVEDECSDRAPAFDPGNHSRCQRCLKLERKKMPIRLW